MPFRLLCLRQLSSVCLSTPARRFQRLSRRATIRSILYDCPGFAARTAYFVPLHRRSFISSHQSSCKNSNLRSNSDNDAYLFSPPFRYLSPTVYLANFPISFTVRESETSLPTLDRAISGRHHPYWNDGALRSLCLTLLTDRVHLCSNHQPQEGEKSRGPEASILVSYEEWRSIVRLFRLDAVFLD